MDHQVKVRGYRIELGEIEAALRGHEEVREAAVVVSEWGGEKRVVAYTVMKGVRAVVTGELRRFVGERLPEYMVPQAFVVLDELPLTSNGKVDRRALSSAEHTRVEAEESYTAPRTALEELLISIWAEVLHAERVGIHDNFFNMGGHSLLATQLMSRVRATFKVELPVRVLFELPTVAGLAERIESDLKEADGTTTIETITRAPRDGALPLSFSQQRLWFLDQLIPQSPFFNMPSVVRLVGRLNLKALEMTLSEIVERHESLRTNFAVVDGQSVQVISPPRPFKMQIIDLSGLPTEVREAEAQRLTAEEAQRPFNLRHDSLLRVTLLVLSAEEHIALLTMHHIVSDGWSMSILIREVGLLYEAFSNNRPVTLPELPIQYADYAMWQRNRQQREVLEKHLGYWRRQLAGMPTVLNLPITKQRRDMQSYDASQETLLIPRELVESLKELSRRESITLFMMMLASFQTLLAWYTKQYDIVIGTPIAGRTRGETEPLIGFFVNNLVLRTDLSGNPTFSEVLKRVREVSLGAYAHQDVPFERLVEELAPERTLSYAPLVQVMMVLQNNPTPSLYLSHLELHYPDTRTETARTDLNLSLTESEQGLTAVLLYNVELFDAIEIVHMVQYLDALIRFVVANPDATLRAVFDHIDALSARHGKVKEQEFWDTGLQQLRGARRKVLARV
jgi:acyl carrier protein